MDQEKIRKDSYDSNGETIDDMPLTPYIKYHLNWLRPQQTPIFVLPELVLPEAFSLDELSDCSHYDNSEAQLDYRSSWFDVMVLDKKFPQDDGEKVSNFTNFGNITGNLIDMSLIKMGLATPKTFLAGQSKLRNSDFD